MNNHNSSNESHDRDSSNGSNRKTWVAAIAGMEATAKAAMAGVNNRNGSKGREYHISIKVSGDGDVSNGSDDRNGSKGNKGSNHRSFDSLHIAVSAPRTARGKRRLKFQPNVTPDFAGQVTCFTLG
jgi:hypothetical protein